jgi:hypothetical protein
VKNIINRSSDFWEAVLVRMDFSELAIPALTTSHNKDMAKPGDLKLQTTQQTTYVVPN